MTFRFLALCLPLAACAAAPSLPTAEQSGLIAVRPYPDESGICQVIGENDLTNRHLGDASLLVGCPNDATAEIAGRQAEGGRVVAVEGEWTLLTLPLR